MKNPGLAPMVLLLAVLLLAWGGMFGLTQVTDATTPRDRATPTATASPTARDRAPADRERLGTARDRASDGSTPPASDRFLGREDRAGSAAENRAVDRAPAAEPSEQRAADEPNFLDRLAGRDGTAASADATRDPDGLSNRGAAALILVLLLVFGTSASRRKR